MENLIIKAREFVERVLSNDKNKVGKEDLDSYIWVFNKIRDSFAHGMYSFDLDNF